MNKTRNKKARGLSRRQFLQGSLGAYGAMLVPALVPSSAFGANAPSNRIVVGFVGVGRMGLGDLREVLGFKQAQVVAVCDVDSKRVEYAKELVENHYAKGAAADSYGGCAGHGDYRDLVARDDIDVVIVCTPDHWHTLPAVAAVKAGKDIFVQKPLTLTIREGRVLSDAVRRYGRVFQIGSQQRSEAQFRQACELVRNG
ncbi:MAG: Gfo/Idh/MocA family oxidoreductase, partial [Phycisphaerales bacterium]